MRRLIFPLLILLLLCGCHADRNESNTTTASSTQPTITEYLYDPNSSIEDFTQGAVQACSLEGRNVTGMCFFAGKLLLLSTDDHVELTTVLALDRAKLGLTQSVALDCAVSADELTVSADGKTAAYYYPQENSVVLLDSDFSELRRIQLPDQVADRPVLTEDLSTAYYCVENSIYALDLESGLPRLLKQHNCLTQRLTALHFDGSILEVYLTLENGKTEVAFISPENGETVGTDDALLKLVSQQDQYLLQRLDGTVTETLIGQLDSPLRSMKTTPAQTLWPVFSLNGLVGVEESTVRLYDLESGKVRSAVDLGGDVQILEADADPSGSRIWLRAQDVRENKALLLCWNVGQTASNDETVYLHDRYTADAPDAEGLARCQQLADSIGKDLGLTLILDSSFPTPESYSYVYEYQVQSIEDALTQLQQTISALPQGFLEKLAAVSQSGTIRIGLVRQINGISGKPSSDLGGLHFVSSGDHYIALTADSNIRTAFLHQLSHVLDSFVYGRSTAYDLWDRLNPADFAYSGSYSVDTTLDDPRLQGEGQCFVSSYGMTYAKEDRATIFTAAMEPGNQALFAIPGLQNKLRNLCTAIRQAYGWEGTELTLPWEQHLKAE